MQLCPRIVAGAVVLALLPLRAWAQAPEPLPTPTPTPAAASDPDGQPAEVPAGEAAPLPPAPPPSPAAAEAAGPAAPVTVPDPSACAPDQVCATSDRGGIDKGSKWWEGFVDLRFGEFRIQAERIEIVEQGFPNGPHQILKATDNVVFMRADERLAGETLSLDLTTSQGTMTNAVGYLQPGVFITCKKLERLDADSYRIEDGTFTSCSQPTARWSFTASWAKIDVDKRIQARNVLFKVKPVPAFYLPYFIYPINRQQRSTGFTFPRFGYSDLKGFETGTAFFWAMGRSVDQTFSADHYSHIGYGGGHELRYQLAGSSRGVFRTYVIRPDAGGPLDYDLNYNALQMFPGRVKGSLVVQQFSDLLSRAQYQETLDLATTRTTQVSANLQRSFKLAQVRAYVENQDTIFDESTSVRRKMPGLRISHYAERIKRSPVVFGFEARGERLGLGDVYPDGEELIDTYDRFDFAPQLSLPLSVPYLQFTPRVTYRTTRYSATRDGDELIGPALTRNFLETGIELLGPHFSRIFVTEGNSYSEKFKHVISPEFNWTYRSKVENFQTIPRFDGTDYLLGTNQFDYGLTQEFYAKRPQTPGGKPATYRFLTWALRQTYYVDVAEGQNEFDPNYSSAAYGPSGRPSHFSPIQSRLRVRPTPQLSTDFTVEYDTNYRQTRGLSLSTNLDSSWGALNVGWSRRAYPANKLATTLTLRSNFVRTRATLRPLGDRLRLSGNFDYDAFKKLKVATGASLDWLIQCCGFRVEYIQRDLGTLKEKSFHFSITLANIGSMGNFQSEENNGMSGLARYR